jgi:hypothetical protein
MFRRFDLAGPVAVTAAVLLALVGARLVQYDGDPTGFVQFGRAAAPVVQPPSDARISSQIGYDGQFFYVQATDPLLRGRAQRALRLTNGEFRGQRMLYPAAAYVFAGGRQGAIPWSLLVLNVLAVLGATAATALFARSRGRSGWWALAVGLNPGMVLAVLRDLSEPMAVAALIGGLVAWRSRRPGVAAVALTVAVLAREVMVLGVLAIAVEAAWRLVVRRDRGAIRRAAPVCLVPAAAFVAWQAYVAQRFDSLAASSTPDNQFATPLDGLIDSADRALSDASLTGGGWDLVFLALMAAAVVVAAAGLRRGLRAPAVAAACFAALLVVIDFGGDHWNYTRLAAPLMASLVVAGLDDGDRPALAVPALTAVLTLVIPVAFSATAGA